MVDSGLPLREASAGERATLDLVDSLHELGVELHITALGATDDMASRAGAIRRAGIGLLAGHGGGVAHLQSVVSQGNYDMVIVHRPGAALVAQVPLAGFTGVSVYFGHDIHQWRLEAQQRIRGDVPSHRSLVDQMAERRCWGAYDITVYPSHREADFARSLAKTAIAMPYYRLTAEDLPPLSLQSNRRGCLMVGSSSHAPNRDSVEFAVNEILPLIDEPLTVVGDWPQAHRAGLESSRVRFVGRVDEPTLRELHSTHLALLAPLRFGAGTRRKLVGAMGLGTPVLTTGEGLRGLLVRDATADDPVLVGTSASEFATHVRFLRDAPAEAEDLADRAQRCVAGVYGSQVYDRSVAELLALAQSLGAGSS